MLIRYTCPTANNTHSGSYCENGSTLRQCTVKEVYKSIFNEKCHPPPPLDDPSLADLGTERVWPGLRLKKKCLELVE